MKKCSNCGFEAIDDDEYCRACGERLIPVNISKSTAGKAKQPVNQTEAGLLKDKSIYAKYSDFLDNKVLYQIGVCKLNGAGVDKDEGVAFEIFQLLAERGYYDGMYKLAEMYLNQTPPNEQLACDWLNIAACGGHEPSKIKLHMLGKSVSVQSDNVQVNGGSLKDLVARALPDMVLIKSSSKNNASMSVGSGFIIEGNYVITNAHVIGTSPAEIKASFESSIDDKTYSLQIVAVRHELDIAVLKFTGLAEEKIKSREHLQLSLEEVTFGDKVYTIGNPLGMGLSLTEGVVSCPNRTASYPKEVDAVIQVDITSNHGNSGGALLDSANRVLGIVTFIPGKSEGAITMCVPSKYIIKVLNDIEKQ